MPGSPDTQHSDRYIVRKVLNGERSAFDEMIKLSSRIVAQITFKMIAIAEDRKDIIQDIYLKAWKNLEGFQFKSRLTTWIAQIAYHTCLNYLESRKIKITADVHVLDDNTSREEMVTYDDVKLILDKEISELPILYKTLITLYHQEELSYEEIADVTRMPVGTVKSYLFRARKRLKESLLTKYKKEDLWR
jgi:RNA polymerase sigma factor (sigma-70 family)